MSDPRATRESFTVYLRRGKRRRAQHDCVARVSGRPRFAHIAPSLRETDVLWTPEFEHPVQCAYGDRDLGRSTLIGARS